MKIASHWDDLAKCYTLTSEGKTFLCFDGDNWEESQGGGASGFPSDAEIHFVGGPQDGEVR